MKRKIVIALLALGTIGGFASGAMSVKCARHRHAAFEQHVAKLCADAARSESAPTGAR